MPESTLQLTGQGSMERQHCMNYGRIEDFINGRIPLEEKRVQMVQNNFSVMEKIYDDYKKGLKELQEILERI